MQESIDAGPRRRGDGPARLAQPAADRRRCSTRSSEHGFDAAFGGARRDEERARAKERIFSFRDDFGQWDPQEPAPRAVEPLQRAHPPRRARARLPALELDRARRLALHRARGARAARRSTSRTSARSSSATGCSTPTSPFVELLARRGDRSTTSVRYRTVGDMTLHRRGAPRRRRRSTTSIAEIAATRITERGATRADDRVLGGRHGGPQAGGLLLMDRDAQRRAPLRAVRPADLLRFATAGSVDDGKSHADRPAALRHQVDLRGPARARRGRLARAAATATSTSRCSPTACAPSASRASRSTSPTATSPRRGASSSSPTRPGHVQYTRNMVTGASTADLAIVLVDARKGVVEQTRRHALHRRRCCGIPHLVRRRQQDGPRRLGRGRLRRDRGRVRASSPRGSTSPDVDAASRSPRCTATTSSTAPTNMPWYDGPTLLDHLETVARSPPTATSTTRASRCSA